MAGVRWLTALGVLSVVAFAVTPRPTGAAPPRQGAIEVRMVEFAFQPQTVTISVGQAVAWVNVGSVTHTTTSVNQIPNDPCCWDVTVQPGFTFERVFSQPGTYQYYCRFHQAQGMTGTIIVQAAATTPSPTATFTPLPAATTPTVTPGPGTPTGQPAFFILSPTEGQTIIGTSVPVQLDVSNIILRPPGTPNRPGEGTFSLFLDNLPEVRLGDRTYTFTNVPFGSHTLRVELRQNDGTPFTPPIQATVNFRTEPGGTPTPMVTGVATGVATPTVGLPKTGDGTYRGESGSVPLWAAVLAPVALFAVVLYARARRAAADRSR
ncbi:MAG: plastocyanin/azurin family copper-binding protein [Chloroflexota bacterium]|nr:plastocyanin/azurin family copper-binding protein [Dehalococcoidia bacterium]MDW8253018.1 plastocyanin/azurin family copper-binding protein [Chloroflexota bacterium]